MHFKAFILYIYYMANRVITLFILTGIVGVIAYLVLQSPNSKQSSQNIEEYVSSVQQERSQKDIFFKADPDSPLNAEQKDTFKQLYYYPIDPNYRIEADVEVMPLPEPIALTTSDGQQRLLNRWGFANFSINGKDQRLLLLKPVEEEENRLFIPFSDATSALQTYGAGRYLDVELPESNTLVLDFNKAYNPYCAYSDNFSCPLPPGENRLQVPIQAGEKTYATKQANTH